MLWVSTLARKNVLEHLQSLPIDTAEYQAQFCTDFLGDFHLLN